MKNYSRRYSKYALGIFAIIFSLSAILWNGDSGLYKPDAVEAKLTQATVVLDEGTVAFDRANPHIQNAMAVQDRHTAYLMAISEVVGTATGLTDDGKPAILVLVKNGVSAGVIPWNLEGVPVVVKVTGEISAMPKPPWAGGGGGGGGDSIDPTKRFNAPVPIGVSTGNSDECSSGTIGARVSDGANVYAMSNNHVYALENSASIGSSILQPGLYDTNCVLDPDNLIGSLSDFEPIIFSTSANNTIDAAIALSSTSDLGNSTPSNGYGAPKSATVSAIVGQSVQKYGRTTSLTRGTITGINATVNVGYSSGTARFVDQIVVSSGKGAFIKPGDSGSLLVTNPDRNPVGLLFAGNRSGKIAIANRIDLVISTLGVTIDGE